jgi:hypothetical protein
VKGGRSENGYGVQRRLFYHLAEIIELVAAFIGLRQPLQTIGPDVANRFHFAFRMQMPLETRAKATAYDADPDRLGGCEGIGILSGGGQRDVRCAEGSHERSSAEVHLFLQFRK